MRPGAARGVRADGAQLRELVLGGLPTNCTGVRSDLSRLLSNQCNSVAIRILSESEADEVYRSALSIP